VAVVDFAAPLPEGEDLIVASKDTRIELSCAAELERYRVQLTAPGRQYGHASALLRGEHGVPVPVELDLVWKTRGEPYAYRVTTRYEIPCRVVGSVRVGGEDLPLSGPRQRDHSWGTRDWWSAEWMWSAGQLEDGTRFHGLVFRLPDRPPIGLGCLQPPEGGVIESNKVTASDQVGPDGLITTARIAVGELALQVQPLAFGPLRLEASNGRITEFPCAMCAVTAADCRTGVAWVEWKRNRSRS
jgi:hypothetical protein